MKNNHEDIYWFRDLTKRPRKDGDYEPMCLWLVPLMLRTRSKYLADAVAATNKLIEYYWEATGMVYKSRQEFNQSDFVDGIWASHAPPWWGLNDIIGWIDIRVCVRKRVVTASLFLPKKRISRLLKDKQFYCREQKRTPMPDPTNNDELREIIYQMVTEILSTKIVKRYYVDVKSWKLRVAHTDLLGIIRAVAIEELEKDQSVSLTMG